MAVAGIAVVWPSKENYARFREICGEGVKDTHDAYVRAAQPKLDELAKRGQRIVKIDVDPDDMAHWCRENFGKVDSQSRAAYAAFCASRGIGT